MAFLTSILGFLIDYQLKISDVLVYGYTFVFLGPKNQERFPQFRSNLVEGLHCTTYKSLHSPTLYLQ